MWEIYDELIDGVDARIVARRVCRGRLRAWVETDDGAGLASLLLKEEVPAPPCDLPQYAGRPLRDLAALVKSWDPLAAAVGMAAINAWYNQPQRLRDLGASVYPPGDCSDSGDVFASLLPQAQGRRVATVGHFRGVRELYQPLCDFTIFEREPRPGDLPDAAEEYLLAGMDLVFITGMAFTNKTMPRLLQLAVSSHVVLAGPSVPLTPLLFAHGVSLLSGTTVTNVAACRQDLAAPSGSDYFAYAAKVLLRP